jgi:hypothetical protein
MQCDVNKLKVYNDYYDDNNSMTETSNINTESSISSFDYDPELSDGNKEQDIIAASVLKSISKSIPPSKPKKFKCKYCDKGFSAASNRSRHISTIHSSLLNAINGDNKGKFINNFNSTASKRPDNFGINNIINSIVCSFCGCECSSIIELQQHSAVSCKLIYPVPRDEKGKNSKYKRMWHKDNYSTKTKLKDNNSETVSLSSKKSYPNASTNAFDKEKEINFKSNSVELNNVGGPVSEIDWSNLALGKDAIILYNHFKDVTDLLTFDKSHGKRLNRVEQNFDKFLQWLGKNENNTITLIENFAGSKKQNFRKNRTEPNGNKY